MTKARQLLIVLLIGFCVISGCDPKPQGAGATYQVDNVPIPDGLLAETGGLDFLSDGRLIACFTRGEVMIFDPKTSEWRLFAEGLHEPLGLVVINDTEIVVLQRPELTRIIDTDNDGKADVYEKITDDFGISGNYHEFNYGPVRDSEGNFYIALNTASSGGGIRENVRGELRLNGRDGEDGKRQMYSVVPYRGWVLKIQPDGTVIPFASGFRSPNGLGFDDLGNLFVTDNQSDWVETSTLYHVKKDRFFGHPASLVWQEEWKDVDPFALPISTLDSLRTKAAVLFPHGIMANSPTQPLFIKNNEQFKDFEGQFLIGEMNRERIFRVMLEEVGGEFQGACIPFIDGQGLRVGNNRLAFGPDGSLWVGQIEHGWRGDQGIQKITSTGNPPMDIAKMSLTRNGFALTFTQPVNPEGALAIKNYQLRHYFYAYQKKPFDEPVDKTTQRDLQSVAIKDITISADQKTVALVLEELKPGYVYELKLDSIFNQSGKPLDNQLIAYTLNNLLPS